jgi:hypothetical protein
VNNLKPKFGARRGQYKFELNQQKKQSEIFTKTITLKNLQYLHADIYRYRLPLNPLTSWL